ncbi:MAG: 16S rRNA (guanine(527)-N(7))-methyltransferase RsmG, partial [Mycobacterium sp.]
MTDIAVVEPPPLAADVFGSRLDIAMRYVGWLTGAGVERGLVGPRESERIWQRHVLNCVGASALVPPNCSVIDIGSGAGLPGVVLAIARPDLDIVLVESMLRRTTFLDDVVADLGLSRVTIHRSRAEDLRNAGLSADVVTARAVAPMDRLAGWAAPLLGDNGQLVALKGSGVVDEVAQALPALRSARLGAG